MIPDNIKKLQDDLDSTRKEISEAQKKIGLLQRKEKTLNNKINTAWEAQHNKIINAVKSITGA